MFFAQLLFVLHCVGIFYNPSSQCIVQIATELDGPAVAMSTSSLRRQVKNIVHNYSEAEIKVVSLSLSALSFPPLIIPPTSPSVAQMTLWHC